MINNHTDYKYFLSRELKPAKSLRDVIFPNPTKIFIKRLRKVELLWNSKGILSNVLFILAYHSYRRISIKTGITIPKNTCDIGLSIPHYGSIVINANCRIGKNCRIHNNVNIGATGGSSKAPRIGDSVYIGPGAVIFGDIEIADNCFIGANAVVNKSFLEPFSVIAGVPARVVKKAEKSWNDMGFA